MHDAVRVFLEDVKRIHPDHFKKKRVLEVGSQDLNGSAREYFKKCEYTGVDWQPGKGVDVVALAHELTYPDNTFDVVVSTECMEHDVHAKLTVSNIIRMLKPGGLCIITAASDNREPHELYCGVDSYYGNIPISFFAEYHKQFKDWEVRQTRNGEDIQFFGIKA